MATCCSGRSTKKLEGGRCDRRSSTEWEEERGGIRVLGELVEKEKEREKSSMSSSDMPVVTR